MVKQVLTKTIKQAMFKKQIKPPFTLRGPNKIWIYISGRHGVTVRRNKNFMFNKIFINGVTVRRNKNFMFNKIFINGQK